MTVDNAEHHARMQPLSCHPSNPFDGPDMTRRDLGYGLSELSGYSSDLGGYGDPEPTHYIHASGNEGCRGAVTKLDASAEVSNVDATELYHDEDIHEDGTLWDEEAIEEEQSIQFKTPEERHEIQAEIQDLEKAVPRLKEDYELVDRLGTGMMVSNI